MLKKVLPAILGISTLFNAHVAMANKAKPLFPVGKGVSIEAHIPANSSQDFTNILYYPILGKCQLHSEYEENPVTFRMVSLSGAIVEPGKDMDEAIWLAEDQTLDMTVKNGEIFGVYAEGHATVNITNHTDKDLRVVCSN